MVAAAHAPRAESASTVARARLRTLRTRDFRNLARLDLSVPDDGMVVIGENGQGKSNLLEAVYYLNLLRSARGARDQDVVRFGAEGFHVSASVEGDRGHELAVGFVKGGRRKRVTIDGAAPVRLSDALGGLPSVMFAPGDVELIAGAPVARRRYLDVMLALSSRPYLAALQRYRAALAHRNAALRDAARAHAHAPPEAIAVWEEPLAEHGALLWHERLVWVARVADRFAARCAAIGEIAPVRMRYVSAVSGIASGASLGEMREVLVRAFAERRAHDLRRGATHVGPHRDDLAITVAGTEGTHRELRTFGSAGQQRTAAIVLRMLEAETLRESRGRDPLFLLDDPFAELDARRTGRIMSILESDGMGQTLLVVPRETDIPDGLSRLRRWRIADGTICRWGDA